MIFMNNELIKSKYLKVIKLDNSFSLIYHSLHGNLVKVNNDVVNLIDKIELLNKDSEQKFNSTIKYLKSKRFLVNKGEDEFSIIKTKLEKRDEKLRKGEFVSDIQLSVSNKCNMNCKYCFEKKFDNSIRDWSKKMDFDMAKKSIEKVVDLAKKNGRDYISINFFGGEPLTNMEVIKNVLQHFGRGEKYDINIGYSIDTNGILINEEVAEMFSKYKVLVNLSIDYISNTSAYRADGNSGVSFEQFDRNLKILKNKEVLTYFLTVLSKDTFDKFSTSLLDYAKDNNVQGNDVILSFDLDFEKQHSAEEIVNKLVQYYVYARKLGIYVGGYWGSIIDQIERVSSRNIEGFKCCPAIGRRLSIEPNGDIFPCKSSSKIYGNIEDIEGALSSKQYHDYGMRAFRNSPSCEGCSIEGFCSGACLGMLEKKYGNILTMDPFLCDIYRNLTREILKAKYANS